MEQPDVFPEDEAPQATWRRYFVPALGRRRPTRRLRALRGIAWLASLVAALLFVGVAAPSLAQARENPQLTTVSSSGEPENPCEYNVTVPGWDTSITVGSIIARGLIPALDKLPGAQAADILYFVGKCSAYLNSHSGQNPYSPTIPDGTTCYSDIEGRHPAGIYKNGQCVKPQEQPQGQDPSENTQPPQNNGGYRLPCILPDGSQGEINNATGQCGPVQ
jgi:hypothetical protein